MMIPMLPQRPVVAFFDGLGGPEPAAHSCRHPHLFRRRKAARIRPGLGGPVGGSTLSITICSMSLPGSNEGKNPFLA